ncbi:MAG: ATP synthase gamma chain [Candidatus Falkowbacteria bacterium GW2011_GWC2_38_22]|uniref:ATP synthase gamma chain n=1 Tax=Candidatus Falkowbacteria bacterium GW2011_GWE1_38_31 TaxID=1618638 RepID=A0A0G0JTG1_9BACT|nr:MAG: ATP synthase gamma chain [Candidatus Falkowbacteria bacterium GW2011_GWF2_38_1205]KKQ61925.1 MAG: ATP synthase gamma chain [Candidatus Falkowbacteria bacterium GW2011_GWC2_38_22]KKQ63913.1 MAG: ATP synthase gamma chain [Candidatus Falkowbacteria bacterium GW2011_GWF1_38_22]KKQ66170.1 MAG: ATP synthase gamma chain [Candidatus Falkowbacteria bacterium GW2011_GWE2_38_254]KKQ70773.1 MAG: ATP synthase gamma chain [Candidatus Falkowbacteria bacterium GW2011_GWE1_38_31]KKQ73143.1 MAG: ATP syn
MPSAKVIKTRIKSVNNTKKITKAMEMVAAAKMRRSVEAVLRTRTYANLSWTTVINLSKAVGAAGSLHPLLTKKEKVRKVAIILLTSNRGLCGGFNSAILKKTHDSVVKHEKNKDGEKIETEIIVVGKKGMGAYSRYGYKVIAEFPKVDIASEALEIRPIASMAVSGYLEGRFDKVMVAFTDFVSASSQAPRIKQLLPVDVVAEKDHYLGVVGRDTRVGLDQEYVKKKEEKYLKEKKDSYTFTFEPSPKEVLDDMVPRLIEIQLFQALLESNASEHSARMTAMHQASESAKDLADRLQLYYNKARQAAITNEIAEISAGANALK